MCLSFWNVYSSSNDSDAVHQQTIGIVNQPGISRGEIGQPVHQMNIIISYGWWAFSIASGPCPRFATQSQPKKPLRIWFGHRHILPALHEDITIAKSRVTSGRIMIRYVWWENQATIYVLYNSLDPVEGWELERAKRREERWEMTCLDEKTTTRKIKVKRTRKEGHSCNFYC